MRAGYVSIIGKPNVGKSTLLNRLLGVKLAAISTKPQTTRNRILGILTENDCQCYFLDTPGLIEPEYELQKLMVKQVNIAIKDADLVLWMVDPWFKSEDYPKFFLMLAKGKPIICLINKIDLVPRPQLLPIFDAIRSFKPDEIVPISALTGDGIDDLKKIIFELLPRGDFLYPVDEISDRPERFFVAELIREKIFETFKKEIPYATCVLIDEFKEREKGKDYIRATIYVERNSQKAIIIGKNGAALKKIGEEARHEIENFLGRSIYLELWVKVKEKWRKNKKLLEELGY